jgi:hypothetical protein
MIPFRSCGEYGGRRGVEQGDDEHISTVLLGTNPIIVGADATEVVTVRSLTKRLGDVVAVDDLTFPPMRAPSRASSVRTARGRRPRFGYCLGLAKPTAGEAPVFGHRFA